MANEDDALVLPFAAFEGGSEDAEDECTSVRADFDED